MPPRVPHEIIVDARGHVMRPYGMAAALILSVFDACGEAAREAAAGRLVTLLLVAPGLRALIAVPDAVTHALTASREGNRRGWTMRLAHGIADFLIDCAGRAGRPLHLVLEDIGRAEPLDGELADILCRRRVSDLLTVECRCGGALPPSRASVFEPSELAGRSRHFMHLAYYEAALACADAALATGAPDIADDAARDRIFALLLLDRHDEAATLCTSWLCDPARNPELRAHAAYALAILAARLRPRADHDYAAARDAILHARNLLEALPATPLRAGNLAFLKNTLALISLRDGDRATALRLLDEAIADLECDAPERRFLDAPILFENRARLHMMNGDEEKALADLGAILTLDPANGEALFNRAMIHQKAGRNDAARADYDAALLWEPPRADAWHNRGLLHWQAGAIEAARADAERGLAMAPDDTALLRLSGLTLMALGRHAEAEARFDEALGIDPSHADAWANRGTLRWRRGDRTGAIADLDQAVALGGGPEITARRDRFGNA